MYFSSNTYFNIFDFFHYYFDLLCLCVCVCVCVCVCIIIIIINVPNYTVKSSYSNQIVSKTRT